ncbi:TolC family protein [Mangrovibacterium diazotrophicum]|uniref:Outer membrane efflux protein n=1 Tax=Mangrovibacterium diazotrophicum TaxID=1261403 RepID=A0A419VUC5_9BACT|nr:TolC family protein [Mangrovibacterium diazotrophicum]RKD85101.1 outer membrane efflux protein [Mangrovibacterium diazotrophicum]
MRKINIALLMLLFAVPALAQQSLYDVLQQIETNNTAYQAQQSQAEAQKAENRIGNTPDNPEVNGGYLWGSPSAIGNRKDFSVNQEIAFPTVYHHQKKLADLRDLQADLSAEQYRLALRQEAAQLWVELVSLNQRIAIQRERTELAVKLGNAYEERLTAGDANRIDRNKAALNAMQAEKELARLQQEKELLQLSLNAINGNQPLPVNGETYEPVRLPAEFDLWEQAVMQNNPTARWYMLEGDAAERELKLNRGKSLPKINGGYMMENTVGEKFQGVTLGLSIPLWENKNTVKAARLLQESTQLEQQDFQLQLTAELQKLYRSVQLASARVEGFREELESMQQQNLLQEALDAGQISLIEYLLEMQFNYEAVDQYLEAQKELQLAWVKMQMLGM